MKILCYLTICCFLGLVVSCTKDKTPLPPIAEEPTKWQKITGNYKVYDTLSNFLYEMKIVHINNDSAKTDTLVYLNLNNRFDVYSRQYLLPNNVDPFFIRIGPEDSIFDKQNNRWQLITYGSTDGCNIWKNDTIIMKYGLTNIKYWIEDATPYLDTVITQVAVKQH